MRDRSFYTRFFEGLFSENGFSSLIFIENSVGLTLENRLLAGVIIFTLLFMYFLVFLGGGAKKRSHAKKAKMWCEKLDQKAQFRYTSISKTKSPRKFENLSFFQKFRF